MELFRNTNINFVGGMKVAFAISMVMLVLSVGSLVIHGGPRMGIDFTGGTVVQVNITPIPDIGTLRSVLESKGYEGVQVTDFGSPDEFLITFATPDVEADAVDNRTNTISSATALLNDLKEGMPGHEIIPDRQESVGPKVGEELKSAAYSSIVAALTLIIIYISLRFIFRYGIAAILALVHDVLITLGVFSLLNLEISLTIVAAFLTIIGYSLNDTIVVFDRIRENMKLRRKESYRDVINRSINECLSRTILTSVTTFFVAITLFLFGGPIIHDFAFALTFGVIIGTYSSMFIATPVLVFWYENWVSDKKRMGKGL